MNRANMPKYETMKRLSFSFGVTPELAAGVREIDHSRPLYVTSPWYDWIVVAPKFLEGVDDYYITLEYSDKYHCTATFKVDNGSAFYDLAYDPVLELWIGERLGSTGGGREPQGLTIP